MIGCQSFGQCHPCFLKAALCNRHWSASMSVTVPMRICVIGSQHCSRRVERYHWHRDVGIDSGWCRAVASSLPSIDDGGRRLTSGGACQHVGRVLSPNHRHVAPQQFHIALLLLYWGKASFWLNSFQVCPGTWQTNQSWQICLGDAGCAASYWLALQLRAAPVRGRPRT